jgi:GT2 family glycosyltransferase
MNIRVIIVTYDAALGRSLVDQFLSQPCQHDVIIDVVDNKGDLFDIGYKLTLRLPTARIVTFRKPPENLGYIRSINFVLRGLADVPREAFVPPPDLVVCCNDDIVLSPWLLDGLAEASKEFGFVQPTFDDANFPTLWPRFYDGRFPAAVDYVGTDCDRPVPFIDGACMAFTWSTFERVGLFDKLFAKYSWGDAFDYSFRCAELGIPVGVTERCYVNHLNHKTQLSLDPSQYMDKAYADLRRTMFLKYRIRDWTGTMRKLMSGELTVYEMLGWSARG